MEYKSISKELMSNLIIVTTLKSNFFLSLDIINRHKNLVIFIVTTNMNLEKKVKLNKLQDKFRNVDFICVD